VRRLIFNWRLPLEVAAVVVVAVTMDVVVASVFI
jgi:hypothetical protein